MQEEFVNADNEAWAQEKDASNKAKAGITPYSDLDNFKEETRDNQTKYLGGKTKMALYDAGLIDSEDMLKKVKNSTLQELKDDGIFTVSSVAVKHSTVGEFSNLSNPKKPAGGKNGGNMTKGGHSQSNMNELAERGIEYRIEKTYDDGVRIGGVANHTTADKRLGNSGQSCFPENWDDDKVAAAGTYTLNRSEVVTELKQGDTLIGYEYAAEYESVLVKVRTDTEHNVGTIFPDVNQGGE